MAGNTLTVEGYLAALPEDRRAALEAVRNVILTNLPEGYEDGIQYGMIGYFVPHRLYPAGYHCNPKEPVPFASLASQKNRMALYLCSLYTQGEEDQRKFRDTWAKTGKKLDMGKSCIRFKKAENLALEVIAGFIRKMPVRKFIALYEAARKS